jgi:5-methylcytosine-specific restriction protein B
LEPALASTTVPVTPKPVQPRPIQNNVRLEAAIPSKLQAILECKGQAILYGSPGTGKTHWGKQTALDLAGIGAFGCLYSDLSSEQKAEVNGDGSNSGLLRCCTFHPAFGYEDFIEGYRPQKSVSGGLIFEKRDGIFKKLCRDAAASITNLFCSLTKSTVATSLASSANC